MNDAKNLRDLSPSEIDTDLAELEYEAMRLAAPLTSLKVRIRDAYRKSQDFRRQTGSSRERAAAQVVVLAAKLPEVVAEVTALLAPSRIAIDAINDEFNSRGGWSRYFLVCNTGGHVHRTRSCSSCFPTTEFVWLPGASGQDGAGLIAMFGATVCSVCFPEAPLDELRAAAKPKHCAGSGEYAEMVYPGGTVDGYGRCPECGKGCKRSANGNLRAHKPAKQ